MTQRELIAPGMTRTLALNRRRRQGFKYGRSGLRQGPLQRGCRLLYPTPVPAPGGLLLVTLCVCLAAPNAALARQTTLSPELQARLNRVAADLYSAEPRPAEAVKELKAILAAAPDSAEAHALLGMAYRAQNSPDLMGESIAELRQAIELKPSLAVARLMLARVYLDMARASRARDELERLRTDMPDSPQVLSLLGEAERAAGNAQRSVDLNREVLQRDPAFAQARYYLGLALLDLKQYPDAVRELQQVAQSGANPAETFLALGVAHASAGDLDSAISALREALRADASRAEARIQLARAYRLKGRFADAAKELDLAAPAATTGVNALYRHLDTELYLEQGLLRMQQGRLQAAADAFRKVLEADADHAEAKMRLAEVQKRLKARAKTPGGA